MARLRFPGSNDGPGHERRTIPFPGTGPKPGPPGPMGFVGPAGPAPPDVLDALDDVSRRMEDLARALGCLGFFDDDDNRPRAA